MLHHTRRILVERPWTSFISALAACATTGVWVKSYLTSVQHIEVSDAVVAQNYFDRVSTVDMAKKPYFCFQSALIFLKDGRSLLLNGHDPELGPGTNGFQNITTTDPIPPYRRLKTVAPSPPRVQIHMPIKASGSVADGVMPTSFITIHITTTKTVSIYFPKPATVGPPPETSGFNKLPHRQ